VTAENEPLDRAARALLEEAFQPRRRVRPRLAEPLRDAAEAEVEAPGGVMALWRLGEGPAVLLVHGFEDDNALWGPLIARLGRYGRAVLVADLPGHGFSTAPLRGPAAAGRLLAEAARRFGPVVGVVGHSFGCAVVMAALKAGLPAARAALIAPPLPGPAVERLRRDGARAPAEVLARAEALLLAEPAAFETLDLLAAASEMQAAALFVHAFDDEQCPPSNSFALARAWPRAEVHMVDDLGHRLVAQDAGVVERVAGFLEDYD
jgi:pimeloyl-ACP methyl ester carboxylesterase